MLRSNNNYTLPFLYYIGSSDQHTININKEEITYIQKDNQGDSNCSCCDKLTEN